MGIVRHAQEAGICQSYTTTTPLELRLTFGATIEARSWDNPQGMYGPTVLGGVADEFGWITAPAYSAISSRRAETVTQGFGHFLWIGNVGNIGSSAQHLWDMAQAGSAGFASHQWTWRDRASAHDCTCDASNGYDMTAMTTEQALSTTADHKGACARGVYLQFISAERGRMSRAQFSQLYEAEWADWNDLPVYEFDRTVHVNAERAQFDEHLPLEVSCDFNVDPMVWTLGQHKGSDCWTFDEIVIPGGATTLQACEELIRRHPNPKTDVIVYGDRSGKSRDTKSKVTDYDQIRGVLGDHYARFSMDVPSANPPVASRVAAVNAKLKAADGTVSMWIHPRCKQLIEDRARVSWKPGTREIDKTNKQRTHASDADDYRWARLFPIEDAAPVFVGAFTAEAPMRDPFIGVRF
jgi:hypothetical protein